jgi:diaminobutyrate-2-oxoglutarate transaminase
MRGLEFAQPQLQTWTGSDFPVGRRAAVGNILERFESVVQSSVRTAPIIFDKAGGSELYDEQGKRYIDFHAAGGSHSFGHNNIEVSSALIDYLCNDRIIQTSDRSSAAKRKFVESFVTCILQPRRLNHKILFTDPAHGLAAEVALRVARRHTKRSGVIAFTNSSHGLTEASLLRFEAHTMLMPFCGYFGENVDTIAYLRRYLEDPASGVGLPAAVIVETAQIHGGMNVASDQWLKALEALCRQFGILFIVDETLTGFGRSGSYFGFEDAGLDPDMILAPSAIAAGLPISILLLKPELDHWRAGDRVGLVQGDNLAFVAAAEVHLQWNDWLTAGIAERSKTLGDVLTAVPARFPNRSLRVRGKGLMWALEFDRPASAAVVSGWALERGLIVEPARLKDNVLLILPPVTIGEDVLREGLDRLIDAVWLFLNHE